MPLNFPEAPISPLVPEEPFSRVNAPVPSSSRLPIFANQASLTPVVCDRQAIGGLLEKIIVKSGLSTKEVARRLDMSPQSIRQYINGRRVRPSLWWFVRLTELTGARLWIEFPSNRVR